MGSVSGFRDGQIASEAVGWLQRLSRATAEEREGFCDWLTRSPDHVREFLAATAVSEELARLVGYAPLSGIVADVARQSASAEDHDESGSIEVPPTTAAFLRDAFSELAPECRRALTLRKVYGLSHRQIADLLEMPQEAVTHNLALASVWLGQLLAPERERRT